MQIPVSINETCSDSHISILDLRSPAISCQANSLTRIFEELLQLGFLLKIETYSVPCQSSSRWGLETWACFGHKSSKAGLLTKCKGLLIFYYHLSKGFSKFLLIKPPSSRSIPYSFFSNAQENCASIY